MKMNCFWLDLIFNPSYDGEAISYIYNKLKDVRRAVFMFMCICFKSDWDQWNSTMRYGEVWIGS